jgi:hypothetical protein
MPRAPIAATRSSRSSTKIVTTEWPAQGDLELWLATGPPSRYDVHHFIAWTSDRHHSRWLESELAKHRLALEIAGKAHALLEMLTEGAPDEPKPKP